MSIPVQAQSSGSGFWQHLFRVDWMLFVAALTIVFTGVMMVHSAEAGIGNAYWTRQAVASVVGLVALVVLTLLPYQFFRMYAKPLYVIMILVLVAVLAHGSNLRGTKGWFHLGPVYLQGSEVAKFIFVLTIGAYLDRRIEWYSPGSLVVPFILAMAPIGLILIEPDFSSSLVFFPVTLVMFYVAGARSLHLLSVMLVGALATLIPLASTYFALSQAMLKGHPILTFIAQAVTGGWDSLWLFLGVCFVLIFVWWVARQLRVYIPSLYLWVTLFLIGLGTVGAMATDKAIKDYQRKRLIAFVNPNLDPLGSGYNVRQSQIAIGSGRLLGKGYGNGTQTRLGFLPSRHTDFIFSVIGEELGFVRSLFVLSMYFLIIWRGFEIAMTSRDRYGSMVAAGFAAMFAFYALLNIGMTMGMAPVAGVPLPMVSYGGSSVVSSMMSIGVLLSIHWRRYLLDAD